ncbi:MAG: sugar phosphate isomerase/epimerase [Fimbriimonadaceae bacterium]|nr:sugar phosphate isomerase/epimerase [Fimbriimonadaceae bacterium]
MGSIPVALQMYTVRDKTAADFAGTYRQVAEIGYQGVEIAGTGGLSAAALNALLDDCGFARCGSHVGLAELEADLPQVIDYNLAIGNPYVVVPYLGEELRRDAAAWRAMGAKFAEYGATLQAAGLQLCYHNHAFEFDVQEDGVYGLDLLYQSAPADLLMAEIDTYWVRFGGQCPVDYVTRYRGRAPLIHLKDMTASEPRTFTEVGTGVLDFAGIIKACAGGNVAAWIVEQDRCAGDSLVSAKTSHDNLRGILASL